MSKKVMILDSTLYAAEHLPGVVFSVNDKKTIFKALTNAGINLINFGLSPQNPQDAELYAYCLQKKNNSTPGCLVNGHLSEIDISADLGMHDIYIDFSANTCLEALSSQQEPKNECFADTIHLIKHAIKRGLHININIHDIAHMSAEFMASCCHVFQDNDVSRLFLCDNSGTITTNHLCKLAETAAQATTQSIMLGIDCCNRYGTATANTLAAINAGIDIAVCAVNGLGMKAPLHEIIGTTEYILKRQTTVEKTALRKLTEILENITGIFLSPLTPLAGFLVNNNCYDAENTTEYDRRLKDFAINRYTQIDHIEQLLSERNLSLNHKELFQLKHLMLQDKQEQDKAFVGKMKKNMTEYYERLLIQSEIRFRELLEMLDTTK